MTNPTNPLLTNRHASIPAFLLVTQPKRNPSLSLHTRNLPQGIDNATLSNNRVCRADAPAEVEFQVCDGQRLGDQREGAAGGEAGAVAGEEGEGRGVLRGEAVGRGEVEGEEGVVD